MSCSVGPSHTRRPLKARRRRVSAATMDVLQAMSLKTEGHSARRPRQRIAAISHGDHHRVVILQLCCDLGDHPGRERGAVGAHQHDGLTVRSGGHTAHGARHARAEVALALFGAQHLSGNAIPCHAASSGPGLMHSSTGPTSGPSACASAWSSKRRASRAAPIAPSAGISRVLANPAWGALANTTMRSASVIRTAAPAPAATRRASRPSAGATSARWWARRRAPPSAAPRS